MKIYSRKLKNNLKIIFAEDNTNPLICLQLYVRIGSAWEKEEEAGFSHFMEHLAFKSTGKFPENSIMDRVTFLGGHSNAYTEYDSTCFYLTLPSEFAAEGIEILAELAMNSNFSKTDFCFEKQVIIEELKQFKNDPEDFFIEEILQDYFKKNRYKNPIIGNLNSLKNANPEMLRHFYRKYYTPENCFLVISGDFIEVPIRETIESYFGNWKNIKTNKITIQKENIPLQPAAFSFSKKISNDMLAFVFPDVAEIDPDAYPLYITMKSFAIGKNSKLHTRLFNREKLIDSIKAHSVSGVNNGATIILVMPKNKADLNRIADIIIEEMEHFRKFGMNQNELNEHKKEVLFSYRYSFEYIESLASSLGNEEIFSDYQKFEQYPENIRKITIPDIDNILIKYFNLNSLYLYHIGNRKPDLTKIITKLKKSDRKSVSGVSHKSFFETRLSNGMKVLLKKVVGKPTIGLSLSYNVSQLNESIEERGINLLTSGLLLYGNEKRNYEQFINFCTANGLNFGISPESESTTARLKCFKEMLPLSIELIADVVNKPLFPKDYIQNLKQSYLSNIERIKDYPQYLSGRLWKEMIFGKNSNFLAKEGTKTTLGKITRNQVIHWHKKYFHPENMALSIVGDFDFDKTLSDIEKNYFSKPNGLIKSQQKIILDSAKVMKKRKNYHSNQSIIHIGGLGCSSVETEKNTAFHFLAQIIGGDTNSILFRELRENLGLAYSVDFSFKSIRKMGFFAASAIVDKKREKEAVESIISVLNEVKKNGISNEEIEKTRNYIRGQRLMEEESMLSQAHTISVLETIGFGYDYYLKRDERLKNVNRNILHEIASEYFNQDDYYFHILS